MKNKILLVIFIIIFPISFINARTMSYIPRVYVTGLAGSSLMGRGDLLIPAYLTNNSSLFVYSMGRVSNENNTWTGSAGLGYRHIVNNKAMFGIYCLADYTDSPKENFWVLGPGVEAIGRLFEFRANGYFPIGKKDWKTQNFADEFGDYSKITFTGNSQYDHWDVYHEEIGIGGDADLGIKIAKIDGVLVKSFINGYYFNMKHNDDILGVGARLTMQLTNYAKVLAAYSYDEYEKNTFMAGIQLSLKVNESDLHQRLFDPLERQFATLGTAKAVPIVRNDTPEDLGPRLEHDNIWFFKTGSNTAQGAGTYEDPFHGFTKAEFEYVTANYSNINATINPYPRLYFNSGTYSLADFGDRFSLSAGWGMYGWNGTKPATGTARPVFIGGFQLNSNTSINNLRLQNNAALDVGIKTINATNVVMNDVTVGNNELNGSFVIGTYMDNSSLTINNSQIYGYSINDNAKGIAAKNNSSITATNNSLIEGTSINANGIALYLEPDTSSIDMNMGPITSDGTAIFKGNGYHGYGLYAENLNPGGKIDIGDINNSNFSANSTKSWTNGWYVATYGAGGNIKIGNIDHSEFTATGTAWQDGIYVYDNQDITIGNINHSTFSGTGGTLGYGINVNSANIVSIGNINDSKFIGTGTNSGYSILAQSYLASGATAIGNITNNTFIAADGSTATGINLYGATVTVNNGDIVNSGADIMTSLANHNYTNIFNVSAGRNARVNGVW